ncbi:MAG: hypothetical protein K6B68_04345 [Eubacterium sp.]|nr:hypothetical protein [Eubacterium sp.]
MRVQIFVRTLDSTYSVFQYSDVLDWKDFLQKEISFSPDILTDNKIPSKMAGWIGYTYRYIQIETGLKSKKIIERIPLDNIVNYYAGLHTVDEIMAYEIISHDFKII